MGMHHMEANKRHEEKARWELNNNSMSDFEEIQEATLNKTFK